MLVEILKSKKYAACTCGFDGPLGRFRLCEVEDVLQKDGSIKRVRSFDGTYRCPMCGTRDPKQRVEEIPEWVEREEGAEA